MKNDTEKMNIYDKAFAAMCNHTFDKFIESLERNGLASKLNPNLK